MNICELWLVLPPDLLAPLLHFSSPPGGRRALRLHHVAKALLICLLFTALFIILPFNNDHWRRKQFICEGAIFRREAPKKIWVVSLILYDAYFFLRSNPRRRVFPAWDDLRKIFIECQRMAKVPNGVEKLPKILTGLSRVHECYTYR